MSEAMGPTTREGVLASLLAHACLFILILLFPGLFTMHREPAVARDPNEPIPLAFVTDGDRPEDLQSRFGDAGDQARSEPRPETAPPPENEDPYSEGNNPNRFLAPPMAEPVQPSPQPGVRAENEKEYPDDTGTLDQPTETAEKDKDARKRGEGAEEDPLTMADAGNLRVPPARADNGSRRSAGSKEGLKDVIGRMSTGLSGDGAPLKFNNPVGGVTGPVGGLSFDTPGFDWGPYSRKIYWIIFNNWVRGWPPAARAGLAGTVTVRFRIHGDGTLDEIQVLSPSGTPAFDTAATLALEASNPLPPLPVDFPEESEGVTGRFIYNMDAP